MEKEPKFKLVQIGWADAIEAADTWLELEDALDWGKDDDWIIHQAGWILKETDNYILLASRFNNASGGRKDTYSGLFKIPKPWITYRKDLS